MLVFFLLSDIARSRGWMVDWFARFPLVVLAVLLVGGSLAAGNAYWNDGVVLSWLLVFAPVVGWLWNVFVQEGNVFFDEAIVPLAWAVFTALVVGTVGYVTGRTVRGVEIRDGQESSTRVLRTPVGDRSQVARWGVLAGGLFVVTSSLIYVTRPFVQLPVEGVSLFELFFPTGVIVANILLGTAVILGWSGLASWPAYRNAGLLVSWGVLFGPMFGAILTTFVMGGISGSGPLVDAALAFVAALVFAVILGTVGFLLGTTVRRIQGSSQGEYTHV